MHAISPTDPTIAETAPDAWEPGPLRPRLGDGAVHVWRADLAAVSDDLIEVLSLDERARAERFLNAHNGRLWARCHGVLRVLLGRYLDADPRRLRFASGAHGKPALLGDSATGLSFNLSHSAGVAVYGFTPTGPIGVDVEVVRRPIDEVAVARRAFGPAYARVLRLRSPSNRRQEFRRSWTRREAELKFRGTGIGGAPGECNTPMVWIGELDFGTEAAGAVAVERRPSELICWDWLGGVPHLQRGHTMSTGTRCRKPWGWQVTPYNSRSRRMTKARSG
jgi:4'-phosphopantetheinyl transferase